MKFQLKAALGAAAILIGTQAMAQITMYEGEGFRGRAITADRDIGDLGRMGFNDRTGSVVIEGGRWEVCEHERFQGRCAVLRRGNYDSLRNIGMDYRFPQCAQLKTGAPTGTKCLCPTHRFTNTASARMSAPSRCPSRRHAL